jgi:hypothetical protein
MKNNKPTIKIYYDSRIGDITFFHELLLGIEEEGIPYEIKGMDGESSMVYSFKAAEESRLDVGLGIGHDGYVTLHHVKLKRDRPLFRINANIQHTSLRLLGSNAARLVKGVPFKDMD